MVQRSESSPPRKRGRRPKREWKRIVGEWSGSGKTQSAFCEEAGIPLSSFCWWRKQLRREEREKERKKQEKKAAGGRKSPAFVSVDLPTSTLGSLPSAAPCCFEVMLANSRSVRVRSGFKEEELGRMLRVVENLPC